MLKRYSYLPGAMLIVAGAVRAVLETTWDATAVAIVAAGVVIVAASVAWNRADVLEWLRDPRGVFFVVTGISVAVLVMILIVLNILVWYNPWRADLTASGRNVVTEETRTILRRLDRPVAFRQFGRAPDPAVDQLLASFAGASRFVQLEFVDLERNVSAAREYGVIKTGTVVVEAGDKHRKVEEPNEPALVTALLQVTSGEERTICFTAGHGERATADSGAGGLARAAAALQAANYRVETISLFEGAVPARCTVAVVAGPRDAWTPSEVERLQSYASSGGRVATFIDPEGATSIVDWLKSFEITPEDGLIVDASGAGRAVGGGPTMPLAVSYGDHPVTRNFGVATMFDRVRSLQLPDATGSSRPVTLARTGDKSFVIGGYTPGKEIRVDPDRDRRGPFTIAAALGVKIKGQARPEEFRLVVVGDSDFAANALLGQQANRDFLLRSVAWLAGEEEATIVNVTPHENRRIELTQRTRAWMYLINVGLLPLIPLVAGIVALLRSRG